jgi:hypothetical protein
MAPFNGALAMAGVVSGDTDTHRLVRARAADGQEDGEARCPDRMRLSAGVDRFGSEGGCGRALGSGGVTRSTTFGFTTSKYRLPMSRHLRLCLRDSDAQHAGR